MSNISSTIAAPGGDIILATGETVSIRYGMSAVKTLEDEFGSINTLIAKITEATDGAFFTSITKALWAGTNRSLPYTEFLDLLDTRRIADYVKTFSDAIGEALGVGEAQAAEETAAEQ
jgi:hypothetical protein